MNELYNIIKDMNLYSNLKENVNSIYNSTINLLENPIVTSGLAIIISTLFTIREEKMIDEKLCSKGYKKRNLNIRIKNK